MQQIELVCWSIVQHFGQVRRNSVRASQRPRLWRECLAPGMKGSRCNSLITKGLALETTRPRCTTVLNGVLLCS